MTREQAIEIVKTQYPHDHVMKTALGLLIPELSESEDERIRKDIVAAVEMFGDFTQGRKKEIYAYLENQNHDGKKWITPAELNRLETLRYEAGFDDGVRSEMEKQKETSKAIEAVDRIDKYIDEHLANAHDMKDSNPDKKYYRGWDDALGKMAGILQDVYSSEKQKEQKPADEQFPPLEGLDAIKAKYYDDGFKNGFDEGVESVKPAEWDDYTKTNLDRALQIIRDAKGTLQGYQSDDGIYECDKAIECIEHFLYHGLEIEKPAEWSEEGALNRTYEEGFNDGLKYRKPVKRSDEDKKMSDWLIGLVNANTELSFKDKVNLTRWLEHLTIEKELSKNDKRIIDAIIIGYQDKDFRSSQIPTPIGVSKDEVIAWLKSLRPQPHWKPSEEQMDALKDIAYGTYQNGDGPELRSLYEQLKKLI